MMTLRNPRLLLLALAALFVPLQAGALEGGNDSAQVEVSVPLSVTASLGQCGTSADAVTCQVTISWNAVSGADYYTAVMTSPDGAYMPLGTVGSGGPGSATVWIPYSGDGTYSLSVMAWGYDTEGKPEKVGKGKSSGAKKSSNAADKPVEIEVETDKPSQSDDNDGGDSGGSGDAKPGKPGKPAGNGPKSTHPQVKVEAETKIAEPAAPKPTPKSPPAPTPAPPPAPPAPPAEAVE